MSKKVPTVVKTSLTNLLAEIDDLRARLDAAELALRAAGGGETAASPALNEKVGPDQVPGRSDTLFRGIVETMTAGALTLDECNTVLYCNPCFAGMVGIPVEQLVGSSFLEFVPSEFRDSFMTFVDGGRVRRTTQEMLLGTVHGRHLHVHLEAGSAFHDPRNVCIIVTDVSARVAAELALQAARDELERRVEERTRELRAVQDQLEDRIRKRTKDFFEMNRVLIDEIDRRKKLEESLDAKSAIVEEVNTALRVLLKQRAEDKDELEKNILSNLKELILPCLGKLKESRLDAEQMNNVRMVEDNLKEIASPIVRKIQGFDLTSREIEVISYLKEGRTTKQIAELLCVSTRTIEFHRYNIRKKLGLGPRESNLRMYLLSLA